MKFHHVPAIVVFSVFPLVYLGICIAEHNSSLFVLASLIVIITVISFEYMFHYRNLPPYPGIDFDFATIASCTVSAVATYFLNNSLALGPAIAAGIVGSLAGFLAMKGNQLMKAIEIPVYCGAFVGMSSSNVLAGTSSAIFAGVVCGFLFNLTHGTLHGYGGRLGTVAFASVGICVITIKALSL